MVRPSVLAAFAACLAGQTACAKISLKVTSGEGNQSTPLLYGAMFEVWFPFLSVCQLADGIDALS